MNTTTTLADLLGGPPKPFRAVAYYNKHRDCIRIELRDCSITEVRISPTLTLLRDNYPSEKQSKWAGVMIKGVRHLFQQWQLPLEGVLYVTQILDEIMKELPQDPENEERKGTQQVYTIAVNTDMVIDMNADSAEQKAA